MILLSQNILCSSILFIRRPKSEQIVIGSLIFLSITTTIFEYFFKLNFQFIFPVLYFSYFIFISYRLFVDVSRQQKVGIETIAAVFCGFILIGVVASMVFISLNESMNAFAGADTNDFSSFLYFSFVTLLTIGYGDITPTTEISQRLVIFFGLIGHFYTVFVIAIIVGKYQGQK